MCVCLSHWLGCIYCITCINYSLTSFTETLSLKISLYTFLKIYFLYFLYFCNLLVLVLVCILVIVSISLSLSLSRFNPCPCLNLNIISLKHLNILFIKNLLSRSNLTLENKFYFNCDPSAGKHNSLTFCWKFIFVGHIYIQTVMKIMH